MTLLRDNIALNIKMENQTNTSGSNRKLFIVALFILGLAALVTVFGGRVEYFKGEVLSPDTKGALDDVIVRAMEAEGTSKESREVLDAVAAYIWDTPNFTQNNLSYAKSVILTDVTPLTMRHPVAGAAVRDIISEMDAVIASLAPTAPSAPSPASEDPADADPLKYPYDYENQPVNPPSDFDDVADFYEEKSTEDILEGWGIENANTGDATSQYDPANRIPDSGSSECDALVNQLNTLASHIDDLYAGLIESRERKANAQDAIDEAVAGILSLPGAEGNAMHEANRDAAILELSLAESAEAGYAAALEVAIPQYNEALANAIAAGCDVNNRSEEFGAMLMILQ